MFFQVPKENTAPPSNRTDAPRSPPKKPDDLQDDIPF